MSLYAYEINENSVGVLPIVKAVILVNDATESYDPNFTTIPVALLKPSLVQTPLNTGVSIIPGGNSDYFPTGYNYQ